VLVAGGAGSPGPMEPRAGSFEVYLDWTGPDGANHTGEPHHTPHRRADASHTPGPHHSGHTGEPHAPRPPYACMTLPPPQSSHYNDLRAAHTRPHSRAHSTRRAGAVAAAGVGAVRPRAWLGL
jgi:hypothetical protein